MVIRIGNFTIPLFRISSLIEPTKIVYEKYPDREVSQDALAALLGHKSKSGGFLYKLASLRAYGLLEGRGNVRITEIGKTLTHPAPEANVYEAAKEAILKIPLWKELYPIIGVEPPVKDFWADLSKIEGISVPESKNKEENVRKAYIGDMSYIKSLKKLGEEEKLPPEVPPKEGLERISFGDVIVQVPRDPKAIDRAKKLLDILKEEIAPKGKTKE